MVSDPSGAHVANAKVVARNIATNETREAMADQGGAFSLNSLAPGSYEVTVENVGFQRATVTGVEVGQGATNRVDVNLKVGSSETVSVTSDTTSVQTDSAEVRGELSNAQLSSLPVPANRNYESALILIPGINPPANQHSVAGNPGRGLSFQSNGSFGNTNNIRIDGATANNVLYGNEVGGRGTRFETRLRVIAPSATIKAERDAILVKGATEAVLLISAGTSYKGPRNSPSRAGTDPSIRAAADLAAASARGVAALRKRHLQDYQGLFQRASLQLDDAGDAARLPTDQRIARFSQGNDASFAALYLHFGRYLTIAGSRPGTQPLNLQGIWNREVIPPWASGYTTNINLEMNYWPTDALNLSECFEPLERLIAECSKTGSDVARSMYHRKGWVLHHNTTLWRGAQPVDNDAMPAFWNMGAGWLCQHLWEHYLFTRDRTFLERSYPMIKGAAEFLSDWLVEDDNGHLLTPAGCSPENIFRYRASDGTMRRSGISMGPTMDIAIIRQVLRNCIAASDVLANDDLFRQQLQARMDRLLPYAIGKRGQLQEWPVDFEEEQQRHRHVSHLYGAFPDNQITAATPALMQAVRRSLELRGDEGTGWSRAWKICLWARLGDGNHAYRLTGNLFQPAKSTNAASEQGGLMPNLFCSCPPMQIDGNFGGAAGIVEMLLQSQEDLIHLLPALPDAWPTGRFHGFRTRAGCDVSAEWQGGKLLSADITAHTDAECDILYAGRQSKLTLRAGKTHRIRPDRPVSLAV